MPALTTRVVERLAQGLERRVNRRGFLARSAVVGSALAVAPTTYVLRPTSAYAAVCRCNGSTCDCGALCCDGYTEFCCTTTGRNSCPAGTVAAGWWKVDGHSLCGGGPRYYLDCNSRCGPCGCPGGVCSGSCSGTSCRCANSSCGNRKTGCTRFRYGQCHQEIPCVGPIVCRVVTCLPPWQIDPACTRTALVDNNTRYHDRACLHRPFGAFDAIRPTAPGQARVVGWVVDPDTTDPIAIHVYADGTPLLAAWADVNRPDMASAAPGYGTNHGFDVAVSPSPNATNLCVYGLNAGHGQGDNPRFCRPIPRAPFGRLDAIAPAPGGVVVTGWAIDPDTAAPVTVHVYSGSDYLGGGLANVRRSDVGEAFPGFGSDHGFELFVSAAPRNHNLRVFGINAAAGSGNTMIGTASMIVGGPPFGRVDVLEGRAGAVRVVGWAIDPDTADPVVVHVYADDRYVGGGPAAVRRADVEARYPSYGGRHGFELEVALPAGQTQVCVYALNRGPSAPNTRLGCGSVVIE